MMRHQWLISRPAMVATTITYEQPLNEPMRICLRLEHLFRQLHEHIREPAPAASHLAMLALLKALNVIDRPDLKTKLTQTLTQQTSTLLQLKHSPEVDNHKLQGLLDTLDRYVTHLHQTTRKIVEPLRENAFLTQIRSHLYNPAGPCNFTTPAYALWLQQPSENRINDLQNWAKEFEPLINIVNAILQIIRESTSPQNIVASQGFYQQMLNATSPCQLIQLTLPIEKNIYPEICAGKHRLVIRFLPLDVNNNENTKQIAEEISFKLNCCRI
ncbi:cell division protein ZapD [Coxiella burnetii]|uniref:cell division protein ZapD n=1 Tax=Coxiella burnetii TaxID=777 RepID=UPI002176747A|nr:cell division protein ZapD [Coxiella burnetii]